MSPNALKPPAHTPHSPHPKPETSPIPSPNPPALTLQPSPAHRRSEARSLLPADGHPLRVGRYYVSVRAAVDLCGDFAITVRNLTQHEFHAAAAA